MTNKIHLPGLNGIRAIASIIVLVFHIDQFLSLFNINSIGFHKNGMAGYGVILFFVLSGYLITYLLLNEKNEFIKIDLFKFYLRRVLRIWPIYYAVILIALLIYIVNPQLINPPKNNLYLTFFLYSFFLSNIGYGLGLGLTIIRPLWSVGVEEQFYAFWPILINKSSNILKTLLIIIFVYLLIKICFRILENDNIYGIIGLCSFDCMAIGGIGAYLVFNNSVYLKILYNPLSQLFSWAALIISILYKPVHLFSIFDNEMNSIFYIIIIINVSTNKRTLINLENRYFDFIGKISYGIYIYHVTILVLLSYCFRNIFGFNFENNFISYFIIYLSVITSTIGVSYISFNFFESYFLKMKTKYSKIESINYVD